MAAPATVDKAAKIKMVVAVGVIVLCVVFLAWYYGLFGGADRPIGQAEPLPVPELPPEQQRIIEQHERQTEILIERGVIQRGGA